MHTAKLTKRRSAGHILLSGAIAIAPFIIPGIAHAAKSKVLYSFDSFDDGDWPNSGVVRGLDGTLYGTATSGGAFVSPCAVNGCGTLYKITPQGQEVTLHDFTPPEANGPLREPALDASGNLYVTACCGGPGGSGAIHKLATDGTYTDLHDFTGGSDGSTPLGATVDSQGNVFGVADGGGESDDGVLFEITAQGGFQLLHSFTGGSDGGFPTGTPLLDDQGNIYGTTQLGGNSTNCGTIFKVTPKGKEKVLHSFVRHVEGCHPYAGVVRDSDGNLYTTTDGGSDGSLGTTLVKLSPSGQLTVLHHFGGLRDGIGVYSPPTLVQNKKGNIQIYGLTTYGGLFGYGTAYKYWGNGQYEVIYNFPGGTGPNGPWGMLAAGPREKFYGATTYGGVNCQTGGFQGCGTVFELRTRSKD